MKTLLWYILAFIVSKRPVAQYLIRRSKRTPYQNIPGYMERDWIFNPYGKDENGDVIDPKYPNLPSIRVHHILREDLDEHPHDHPWDARTIIMLGWYIEHRDGKIHIRSPGDTIKINFEEYHRITNVSRGGVYTLFFTWKWQGVWGFLVDGVKIPWKEYKRLHPERFHA